LTGLIRFIYNSVQSLIFGPPGISSFVVLRVFFQLLKHELATQRVSSPISCIKWPFRDTRHVARSLLVAAVGVGVSCCQRAHISVSKRIIE